MHINPLFKSTNNLNYKNDKNSNSKPQYFLPRNDSGFFSISSVSSGDDVLKSNMYRSEGSLNTKNEEYIAINPSVSKNFNELLNKILKSGKNEFNYSGKNFSLKSARYKWLVNTYATPIGKLKYKIKEELIDLIQCVLKEKVNNELITIEPNRNLLDVTVNNEIRNDIPRNKAFSDKADKEKIQEAYNHYNTLMDSFTQNPHEQSLKSMPDDYLLTSHEQSLKSMPDDYLLTLIAGTTIPCMHHAFIQNGLKTQISILKRNQTFKIIYEDGLNKLNIITECKTALLNKKLEATNITLVFQDLLRVERDTNKLNLKLLESSLDVKLEVPEV